jgi:hypothetical protein
MKSSLWSATWATLFSVSLLAAHAREGHLTQEGRAKVILTVPYRTLLRNENVQFTVRLLNQSEGELPYIADSYDVAGKQVFIHVERGIAGYTGPLHVDFGAQFHGSRVLTIEKDGKWESVVEKANAVLRPGEAVEWAGSRFDDVLFFITHAKPTSMQAKVLVGPEQWVSSEPVPIKVIRRDISQCPIVFQEYYFEMPTRTRSPVRIRRVVIEGQAYLFHEMSSRVCRVPRGAVPRFALDPETSILTVHFPNTEVPPVRYNCQMMKRLPDDRKRTPTSDGQETPPDK